MGVEYLDCPVCDQTFADCGGVSCQGCGRMYCSEKCAKEAISEWGDHEECRDCTELKTQVFLVLAPESGNNQRRAFSRVARIGQGAGHRRASGRMRCGPPDGRHHLRRMQKTLLAYMGHGHDGLCCGGSCRERAPSASSDSEQLQRHDYLFKDRAPFVPSEQCLDCYVRELLDG